MAGLRRTLTVLTVIAALATPCAHAAAAGSLAYLQPLAPALDARFRVPAIDPATALEPVAVPVGDAPAGQAMTGPSARLRDTLVNLALALRHVRYVRGGQSPATGFDCSGFVRYVFARATGHELPGTSASQYRSGERVARDAIEAGDLVFFHTRGARRVTHVGIYLDHGRFIHAPSPGKSVEVSSLDDGYWARRFAGARRPGLLARSD